MSLQSISLYIHIPFCETKCPYCDFNTYEGIEPLISPYVRSLRQEASLWGKALEHPAVNSIFFGGGTPSYLSAEEIGSVIQQVRSDFQIMPDAEITLEANPGDMTLEKLRAFGALGINRLSIGFQSLEERLLKLLGRRHSAEQAIEAFQLAREADFTNVNTDLMYGISYQTLDEWEATLRQTLSLEPDHLSLYALTLEGGTPMERWVRTGQLPEPDPDLAADMYLLAEDMLDKAGLRHYEISNWAKPGYESRHNLTYWRNLPYLGLGPGAHSYLEGHRFFNLKSPRDYMRKLQDAPWDNPPVGLQEAFRSIHVVQDVEPIGRELEMAETMMMGLRLHEGVSAKGFVERFGEGLLQHYDQEIQELTSLGLLELKEDALRLTDRGRLLGNEVFQRFVGRGMAAGDS